MVAMHKVTVVDDAVAAPAAAPPQQYCFLPLCLGWCPHYQQPAGKSAIGGRRLVPS